MSVDLEAFPILKSHYFSQGGALGYEFIATEKSKVLNGATFSVDNPATGETIAEVADYTEEDVKDVIQLASNAFILWSSSTAKERSLILKRWYELICEYKSELAELMTLECGKPLHESEGEVNYGASFVEWFSEEAKRAYGDVIPAPINDRKVLVEKQAVGVCSAITPWNFPLAMITRKCAPALAAGCTVIVKPAEATPLTALVLAALAELAGIPKGVFNVVTARTGDRIGHLLTTHPIIKKISFTGSTSVGKVLLKQSAETVKRVSMELGGNAPFIVFEDADIDAAIVGAMASKYRNSGQTCVCANRFIIHESIVDEFASRLVKASQSLVVGNGLDQGVQQGPLITEQAKNKVDALVKDAVTLGACVLTGGDSSTLSGRFYPPTVLTGVTQEMAIAQEEIFGPVCAITTFNSDDQAIKMANSSPYGLAAYFYTVNYQRIHRVAKALDFGMVGVNEGIISTEVAPFGGMKESGLGREGSYYGLDEYLETKYVCLGGLPFALL
jgi:succinate-semialdehyde dehydrogenase/glutarate-semialdehyde dehydrogenase